MDERGHQNRHFDTQAFLYRSIIQISVILGLGILIKLVFVDVIRMSGNQMHPTVLSGDRLLVFRSPYLPVFNKMIKPGYKKPVLFRMPSDREKLGCLRIAALSTDTVSIDSGMFINLGNPALTFPFIGKDDQIHPENYSPRDYFKLYRVPAAGDMIQLDSLCSRDLFFAVSVIRQENPKDPIGIKPLLYIDDSLAEDYQISGFTLYSGSIDSIPSELSTDWFFWVRLENYLKQVILPRTVSLSFAVKFDGTRIHQYIVKSDFVFLLADNWNSGLDSRYFGPVKSTNIIGRVFSVLWSHERENGKKGHFRLNRLGKIIS
jgi:signal peptidase I